MYIWQRPGWPDFRQDHARLAGPLGRARHAQGRLRGRMEALGPALRGAAMLGTLTEDVVTSGGIDGDSLDPGRVRAAIAHRLGRPRAGAPAPDHRAGEPPAPDPGADGIVEMTLDATRNFAEPLTEERLCAWHAALYPGGFSGVRPIRAGRWRDDADGPMEIVSGPPGLQRVHYTAPPAARVAGEMAGFLDWFEDARADEPVLAAGLAYLRFLSIYPFEDGNERIARAITDIALARSDGERFYSLTAQIGRDREDYYAILEATQTGGLDVTDWQEWFLECLVRAIANARHTGVLARARLGETHALNPRQTRTLDRLLDGTEGRLTSSGWAAMNRCSQDTANRDIRDLVERGILVRGEAGGRSTSYGMVGGWG